VLVLVLVAVAVAVAVLVPTLVRRCARAGRGP
jgi:hypothetical protein